MIALPRVAVRAFVISLWFAAESVHPACGELVTSFHEAFQLSTPAEGWSYLWNGNGPIGDRANYLPLSATSIGIYTTDGSDVRPAPPPGSFLSFSHQLGQPGGHPGMGALQSGSGGIERYCIATYTLLSPSRISLQNGILRNINPNNGGSTDGLSLKVFVNDIPTPLLNSGTAPGFDQAIEFSVSLGDLAAGDQIYVAIGSKDYDSFDGFNLRYDIVAVPEPTTVLLAFGSLAMLLTWRPAK